MEFTNKKYVGGYADNTFRPSNFVTRAEFVTIINGVFGFIIDEENNCTFSDVHDEDWYAKQISTAQRVGYISGYQNNKFLPKEPITRQEAFVIIARILNLDENLEDDAVGLERFNDADEVQAWAYRIINNYVKYNLVGGYSDLTIRLQNNITRAETVSLLNQTKISLNDESV